MAEDPEVVKSALQMLAESEGREFKPAPTPERREEPTLQPLDQYSAQFGQAAPAQASTMGYPEQMRNVWETVRPTPQGGQDAAAIAASSIYGMPMDMVGLLSGAREVLKGRIPSHEELALPGGSQYLEQKAKEKGTLSQDPSAASQAAGIVGGFLADPLAAAGKFGTLAAAAVPARVAGAAEKAAPVVEKALQTTRELTPLGLYSHAAETAAGLKQTSTPEQALAWLTKQPGVRKEELFEAGIVDAKGKPTQDFLSMGKVTGQQLAEKIQKGAPDVTETVLGGGQPQYNVMLNGQVVKSFPTWEEASQYAHRADKPLRGSNLHGVVEAYPEGYKEPLYGPRDYPEASTPGGSNYREVLLQSPQKETTTEGVNPNYTMGHYRDYPNVLAHIRMQDVPDEAGGKILRVEEIQSDWAQGGRQKGWRVTPEEYQAMELEFEMAQVEKHKAYKRAMDEYEAAFTRNPNGLATDEKYQAAYKEYEDAKNKYDKVKRAYDAYDPSRVHPKGPYVQETKDWADLALKRIFNEAASNPEYNKFQITAGDVQANRWGASEDAEGVAKFYDTTVKSQLEKQIKKIDPEAKVTKRKVEKNAENDPEMERAYDNMESLREEMAQIKDEMGNLQWGSDEYVDLEYRLSDLENEFEEASAIYNRLTEPYHFYEVEITPKMREAVKKGLPRFKRGGKVNAHSESIVNKALMLSSKKA